MDTLDLRETGKKKAKPPVIVGVAGGTGSGKTTVVQRIYETLGPDDVVIIPHDAYYLDRSHLSMEERGKINYDHPDALETSLLIEHLKRLLAGEPVDIPNYDFSMHVRQMNYRRVAPCKVIIVEGILILANEELRKLFDIKIFVDTDTDIRFIRRMERDIMDRARTRESVVKQYMESVRPMHIAYVEPSKMYADIIIPEGGYNLVAVDMILTKIQAIIENW
ncbi:MAG: uridine kinase [Anaerolineales bacterium]|nr:uridine kinase [Anaerolineales bacterium]